MGLPSVLARMRRPVGKTSEATSHRSGALLDELLTWAWVQTTTPRTAVAAVAAASVAVVVAALAMLAPAAAAGVAAVVAVAVLVPIRLLRAQPCHSSSIAARLRLG